MSSNTAKLIIWAWLLSLVLCSPCSADASTTFDAVPLIQQDTQQLTTSDLADTLSLIIDILDNHNIRKESSALQQYVEQLRAVLQPDCCDYFTALPTVKGLSAAMSEVLQLQLPAALRPVVRRSYVGAIWLLQRSRFFKWDSHTLQKSAMSGMVKLFETHMEAAAGRPISFHHISKTGGTSLCSVAWDNGCRGPGMSKKDNCLLDTGADGPVWVLRHNVTAVNSLTPVPPPPPPPPVMADAAAEEERLQLAAATHRLLKQRSYDWWMYDCPVEQLAGSVGRGCGELQEGAISKSATFFAIENTLPTEHGNPKVCEAFINVVIVRESLGEVMSLMTEVALVYTRLLKQHRVLGWTPPKWDLAWWQQWAPPVVNSYATRTLLGAAAYCPAAPAQSPAAATATLQTEQMTAAGGSSSSSSSGGGSAGALPWVLSADDVRKALQVLASFDLVLDLGSLELMDESLTKLLGWSGQTYSKGRHQRSSRAVSPPTWEQLELLARQQSAPLKDTSLPGGAAGSTGSSSGGSGSSSYVSGGGSASAAAAGPGQAAAAPQQQQSGVTASATADSSKGDTAASADVDSIRRLIGEVRVRQVYSSQGLSGVLLPLAPEVPLLQPPAAVVTAAVAALAAARQGPINVEKVMGADGSSHLLVKLQVGQAGPVGKPPVVQAGSLEKLPVGQAGPGANSTSAAAAATGAGAGAGATVGDVLYHVWLKHGVVLVESQYQQLLRATAADAQLYRAGRVMQALDAGWVSVLGQQRSVRKMMAQVQEEAGSVCGFAGLNHMQA